MVAPAGAHDAQSAVVSAALSCQDRRSRTAQRGRPSRVIPLRDGVDRCKGRTPREPWRFDRCKELRPRRRSNRPDRRGCSVRERRFVEGLHSSSFGMCSWLESDGARSPVSGLCPVVSEVIRARLLVGTVRDGVSGSVWPPHACTSSAAHLTRGASPPIMAGRRAAAGDVRRPRNAEERSRTLRRWRYVSWLLVRVRRTVAAASRASPRRSLALGRRRARASLSGSPSLPRSSENRSRARKCDHPIRWTAVATRSNTSSASSQSDAAHNSERAACSSSTLCSRSASHSGASESASIFASCSPRRRTSWTVSSACNSTRPVGVSDVR